MKPATLFSVTFPSLPPFSLKRPREQGAALVIVLAFMVMLVGVVVAFFVKASNDRQVADSSASQTSAELFARGAMDTIIGDLRQEIAEGSTEVTGSVTNPVYLPWVVNGGSNVWSNAVPALVGSSGTNGLQNLVKISTNAPFYSRLGPSGMVSGTNRVSSISTTNASLNYRSMSAARWNRPLFITPTSATDYTPLLTAPATFPTPSWIYVDRAGGNPKTWTTSLRFSPTNPTSVIGRYAYAIYDEGGLLDINAAGFPSAMTNSSLSTSFTRTNNPYTKISQAHADLSQLTTAGGTPLLTTNQIDQLINWRNTAILTNTSPAVMAISYGNYARSFPDFLSAGNTSLFIGNSDHPFATRQQLVNYVTRQLGGSTNTNTLQALQYFSTFTRSLNQPSLYWPTNIELIKSGIGNPATNVNYTDYTGGNSDFGKDSQINTNFLAVRVTANFTRNDGSRAIVGEPLIKKCFPLEYLTWITAWGPISDGLPGTASSSAGIANATSVDDPLGYRRIIAGTYFTNNGISWSTLQKGTASNIRSYFGLVWNSADKTWDYNPRGSSNAPIQFLSQLAGTGEPNFIELLKASIKAGSLGRSTGSLDNTTTDTNNNGVHQYYTSTDNHLFQIAANIIEQSKLDSIPVRIRFNPNSTNSYIFSGSENLPYLYRFHNHPVRVSEATTNNTSIGDPRVGNWVGWNVNLNQVPPRQFIYGFTTNRTINPMMDPTNQWVSLTNIWTNGSNVHFGYSSNSNNTIVPIARVTINTNSGNQFYYSEKFIDTNIITNSWTNYYVNKPYPSAQKFYPGYEVVLLNPHLWNPYDINSSSGFQTPSQLRVVVDSAIALPGSNNPNGNFPVSTNNANNAVKMNAGSSGSQASDTLSNYKLNPTNAALVFNYLPARFFREPTCLISSNSSYGLSNSGINLLGGVSLTNSAGTNLIANGYIYDCRDAAKSNPLIGIYMGATMISTNNPIPNTSSNCIVDIKTINSSSDHWDDPRWNNGVLTVRLQFFDSVSSLWRDYGVYYRVTPPADNGYQESSSVGWQMPTAADDYSSTNLAGPGTNADAGQVTLLNTCYGSGFGWLNDPRTCRFAIQESFGVPFVTMPNGLSLTNYLTNSSTNSSIINMYNNFTANNNTFATMVFGANNYSVSANYKTRYRTNAGFTNFNARLWDAALMINSTNGLAANFGYYRDSDNVVRRASAAYVPVINSSGFVFSTNIGVPSYTATTNWNTTTPQATSQSQSRPVMLHRPFRSVAELGYVFRDIPWKNLDFFTPESGDAGLLDTFTVHDFGDQNAMTAGRVNLNTRQAPVIRALLSGSQTDELFKLGTFNYSFPSNSVQISATEMTNIASRLIARTATSPLTHLGDLVGQWGGGSYSGFSADLTNCYTNPANIYIQRFHESAIRSLANSGQTRVWNLMIDLVVQTGRFPASAGLLSNFLVEGERRVWIHVAIDRFTGAVLECQIEPVNE